MDSMVSPTYFPFVLVSNRTIYRNRTVSFLAKFEGLDVAGGMEVM
jgi:hypothetical protein